MKSIKRSIIMAFALMVGTAAMAQNPIITDQFSADPTARVFDGKIYVYPSHDEKNPDVTNKNAWFKMKDYHVFSSENLTDWTDHGVIVDQNNVEWVNNTSYSMWAPDCIKRDGTYYFFFPANGKGGFRGFAVGIATAPTPHGPFTPRTEPIKGLMGIDPCILQDDDGKMYIYWGMNGIAGAELNDSMTALVGKSVKLDGDLPAKGLKEGPFVFKRNGIYYLTFPWARDVQEALVYCTSDNPLGPFKYQGVIMEETGCWTNHHSLVEYNGQWYLFYHRNDLSPEFDKNRSVCADSIFFNEDGTIQQVTPTKRGVGISRAEGKVQIDRYSEISAEGAEIAFNNPENTFKGWKTIFTSKQGWVKYNKVDFGKTGSLKTVHLMVKAEKGATLLIKQGGIKGKTIATVKVPALAKMTEFAAKCKMPKGVADITVASATDNNVEVDWVSFSSAKETGIMTPKTPIYRNYFRELGYSQAEIDKKIADAFYEVFESERAAYKAVGDTLGYVSDVKNHDVRTEGQSYGMMVAVQLDKQDIFNRIWRWSKKNMQVKEGPRKGLFDWSISPDGVSRRARGSASDGELYFVTDLLLASRRWGNNGEINYLKEAQTLLNDLFSKDGSNGVTNIINMEHKLINFCPDSRSNEWTDPSYHLPAFYEIWAETANDGREALYRELADNARQYLHKATDPVTGINPDQSQFDGTPTRGSEFHYDSWRVPMNIAMDFCWYNKDAEWQKEYADKFQATMAKGGITTFPDQFALNGGKPAFVMGAGGYRTLRHSIGLVGTTAAASLMTDNQYSKDFVRHLWDMKLEPYEDGYYDVYYDGLLYIFALLHLSGQYQNFGE